MILTSAGELYVRPHEAVIDALRTTLDAAWRG
jgi:hypothetical protein